MQFKIFTIPVENSEPHVEEMNHFLRANKVVDVKKESVMSNGSCYWTFCVTFIPSTVSHEKTPKQKVDYKNVLSPDVFNKFAIMRKIRKEIADNEGIPPYVIFTDAELSQIAELDEVTPKAMERINGIGGRRVEKYGERICETLKLLMDEGDETSGSLNGENL